MILYDKSNFAEGEFTISLPAAQKVLSRKEIPAFSQPELATEGECLAITFTNSKIGRVRLLLRIDGIKITRDMAEAQVYLEDIRLLSSGVMNFFKDALMLTGLEAKILQLLPGPIKVTAGDAPKSYVVDFFELIRKKKLNTGNGVIDSCRAGPDCLILHFVIHDIL